MSFLAIDVGNTRLKWALFDAARPGAATLAHGVEFLDHVHRLGEGAWAQLPQPAHVLGCVVAADAIKRIVEEQMDAWDVSPHWVVPSAEEQARMLQPEDLGRTIAFVANMPPHVCVNEILISPTWNRSFVAMASH